MKLDNDSMACMPGFVNILELVKVYTSTIRSKTAKTVAANLLGVNSAGINRTNVSPNIFHQP